MRRRGGVQRRVVRVVLAALAAGAATLVMVVPGSAQTSDPTTTTTTTAGDATTPGGGTSSGPGPQAITPPFATISAGGAACGLNLGVAFDGSRLLVSCEVDSRIDAVNPTDGTLLQTYNVPGLTALGAIAWDGPRGVLYGCDAGNVVKLDLAANTRTLLFASPSGCRDGLGYDGTDDTFWISDDASSLITHTTYAGATLGTHTFTGGELGNNANSGIAVGGTTLYLANNGGSQIYTSDKAFASIQLFATLDQRLEDLECDNVTFGSQGTTVVWVIDAFDRTLNAFVIPTGSCGFGGVAPAVVSVTARFTG